MNGVRPEIARARVLFQHKGERAALKPNDLPLLFGGVAPLNRQRVPVQHVKQ